MKEKLLELWDKLRSSWKNATQKAKVITLLSIAGGVVLLALLIIWVTHVNYVAIGYNMSPQESAEVLSVLGEMEVEPRVSSTGAIMVPEGDANRVRMQLATRMSGSFGYEIYDGLGLTATQSDKNQAQIYQLQNRLQGMIETFDEVSQAVVTLSIPQPSIYALQGDSNAPTASVKLQTRTGHTLSEEQIQGIINIVKNAVAGLTEDNISISDQRGDLKSQMNATGSSSLNKLNLTEQVNSSVRSRILSVLTPVFGSDNVQVAVNSVLDTDQRASESMTYIPHDPNNPQNNPLSAAEIEREKIGGGDGGPAEGVVGANDNVNVPQYSAQDLDVTDGDSYAARDVYNYLVSSVRDEIIKEGLEITDLTIAVVINDMPDSLKDQVVDLVMGASGVTADKIKVQGMHFSETIDGVIVPEGIDPVKALIITIVMIIALLLLVALIILQMRKRSREREEALAAEAALAADMTLVDLMGEEGEFEPIPIIETQEQKLKAQIRDLANSDPEIVAQLIKTWLVSG